MEAMKRIRDTIYRVKARYTREQWNRIGIAALICIFALISCITLPLCISRGYEYTRARNSLGERIYTYLLMFADSADSEGGVSASSLENMQQWCAVVKELDSYLTERFGARYSVLTSDRMENMASALSTMKRAHETGNNMQEAEKVMGVCMNGIRTMLSERYTRDLRLRPAK